MAAFNAKKVSKVKGIDADASYSVEGTDVGSFAIASSKKELKQLMKSDADVVYYEKKGKLYLNENGEEKGWGAKKVGGLMASFKEKPELSADHFEGMETFDADEAPMQTMFSSKSAAKSAAPNFGCKGAHKMGDNWMVCSNHSDMVMPSDQQNLTNTGGDDISIQFKAYRDGLSDAEESMLFGEALINPKKGIKMIIKDGKKDGYIFDLDELAEELNEMNKGGAFSDIELDAAAMEAMFSPGGEQEQYHNSGC